MLFIRRLLTTCLPLWAVATILAGSTSAHAERPEIAVSLSAGAQDVPGGGYLPVRLAGGIRKPLARHLQLIGWAGLGYAPFADPGGENLAKGWDAELGGGVELELCTGRGTPVCLGARVGLVLERLEVRPGEHSYVAWRHAAALAPYASIGRVALGVEYRPGRIFGEREPYYGRTDSSWWTDRRF